MGRPGRGAAAAAAGHDAAARTDRAVAEAPAARRAMVTEPPGRGRPDQPRGARRLRRAPPGGRDRARLHRGPARPRRGALAAVRAAAAAARGRARRRHRQPLDRRYGGRRAARRRRARRDRPARGSPVPVRGRPLRCRAPRHPCRLGAQPGVLLQLVVLACADRLRAQVGRRHGAHRPCSCDGARPCLAARGRRSGDSDPAPPALCGRRAAGVPRLPVTQLRAVGLAQPARAAVREGDGVGAATVVPRCRRHAARALVFRAQVPRLRRVRPLVRHRTSTRPGGRAGSSASTRCSTRSRAAGTRPRA